MPSWPLSKIFNPPFIGRSLEIMSVRTLVKSIQNIMRQDTGVDGDA